MAKPTGMTLTLKQSKGATRDELAGALTVAVESR